MNNPASKKLQFEKVTPQSVEHLDFYVTQFNGHTVYYYVDSRNVTCVWYPQAHVVSICPEHEGDLNSFVCQDTNWPFED